VPALPGVYVFLGGDREVLYVGKSKNLRARLASYFGGAVPRSRKLRALRDFCHSVWVERMGSEFAALLREVRLVQQLAPMHNQRLRHPERYAYVGVDFREAFPLLVVTTEPWQGGRFLGPFPRRRGAAAAVQVIADAFGLRTCDPMPKDDACWRHQVRRCSAPCIGRTNRGEYGRQLLRALSTLSGRSPVVLKELALERDRLSAAERFEEAARCQRSIEAIRRVRRLLFVTQQSGTDAVVVQPGPFSGTVCFWAIVDGSVRHRVSSHCRSVAQVFPDLWEALQRENHTGSPMVAQSELDARWIVRRWLRSPHGRRWSVPVGGRSRAVVHDEVATMASAAAADLFHVPPP
jgi:excinuclease ABC subunit C